MSGLKASTLNAALVACIEALQQRVTDERQWVPVWLTRTILLLKKFFGIASSVNICSVWPLTDGGWWTRAVNWHGWRRSGPTSK